MTLLERRPPVAMPDPPARFERQAPRPPALQLQLGIRPTSPATDLEDYGPTSHCTEDALFFAYRNADPDREIG